MAHKPTSRNRFSLAISSTETTSLRGSNDASDSQRSPLLPRGHPDITDVPPTNADLNAAERTSLQRKARKLSRVFGELAVLDSTRQTDENTFGPSFPASLKRRTSRLARTSSGSVLKSRASWTLRSRGGTSTPTTPTFVLPPLRSFALSRTGSGPRSPAGCAEPTSYFPKEQEQDTRPSTSTSFSSYYTMHDGDSTVDIDVQIAGPEPERMRRMQMSKVSRALGENNVPAELIAPHKPKTTTLRRRLSRRKSLDLSTPDRVDKTLKRSRSMWLRKEASDSDAVDLQTRYNREILGEPTQGPLSDKQKAMNVRRARKLVQVFGQEPPPGLFQINYRLEDDHPLLADADPFRSSTATLSFFASDSHKVNSHARQPSESSVSSASEGLSTPTKDLLPHTPPPFATSFPMPAALEPNPQREHVEEAEHFQERRRRAAKLARFFGVAVPGVPSTSDVRLPQVATQDVDVKVNGPGRHFWNRDTKDRTDLHMTDAIDLLRGLKAS